MENPSTMNFDLNLIPTSDSSYGGDEHASESYPIAAMNFENWLGSPAVHFISEIVGARARSNRLLWRPPIPLKLTIGGETGEGSVAAEETTTEPCENGNGYVEDKTMGKKVDPGKNIEEESSCCFDCNICFDLAKEPVVTCCGHLFCWRCLYQWVNHRSGGSECPVCKGDVNMEDVALIYGGGSNAVEPNFHWIPLRHHSRQGESESSTQATSQSVVLTDQSRELDNALTDQGQELDNAVEMDFTATVFASSSVTSNDNASRASNFDSGDSPPTRRRRLN